MCNAKPGQRCQKDSFNVLRSKIQRFSKVTEKLDLENLSREQAQKISALSREIADQKVFFYATSGSQGNSHEALNQVASLHKKVVLDGIDLMNHNERNLYMAGFYLSKMQEFADKYRQNNNLTQLETARKMVSVSGFDAVVRGMETKLSNEEEAKTREIIPMNQRYPGWENEPEITQLRTKYLDHGKALSEAFRIASEDADSVVSRDCRRNSKTFNIGTEESPVKLAYWKKYDGVFEVSSVYEVDAETPEEAEAKAKKSFGWPLSEHVVTPKPGVPGTYVSKIKYNWQGSENVEDAYSHHIRFWQPFT